MVASEPYLVHRAGHAEAHLVVDLRAVSLQAGEGHKAIEARGRPLGVRSQELAVVRPKDVFAPVAPRGAGLEIDEEDVAGRPLGEREDLFVERVTDVLDVDELRQRVHY